MPQPDEPEITIGGQRLTEAQAMTVRVAVCSFAMQLENGLGDDEVGKGITRGYQERIAEITELMNGKEKTCTKKH